MPSSKNIDIAAERLAAEQGDARAQFNLGICYLNSINVTKDYAEAVKWLRKAADQGHAAAKDVLLNLAN